ncbi:MULTISPECIES: EamA family transporter RarD [Stutzerimonas stutzeri subgroup]|uniref:EamA family transporter RarD n=1 Tax=Stutzerimonas stutzeri subgroup TaxID=578833 RepID=UPI00052D0CC5|nr:MULTISPECIES: EamA family transporter RarD [Stutzerimonas stutzeri subgroup]UEG62665.1 EamA family transporter RarD [Stutzerimonas chloritidismutans]UIP34079.1 EamA family transporter RarD [Stutzerimonas kunmingensis]CEG50839.1 Chloramphenicol-sensitive protein RarD [Stutzerimonas xanthomarina]
METRNRLAGVAGSLAASTLFATLYYYTSLLEPLSGQQIYGWRILLTAPCLALLLLAIGRWGEVREILVRLPAEPRLWLALPLSSALVGLQLWLFMWAPINGHGLDVSLGYFLLPLTLVLTGRLVFGETISRLQRLACLLAAVGVGNQLLLASSLSWPVLAVALGYPCYFVLRRKLGTASLGGLWVDLVISLPVAALFVLGSGETLNLLAGNPRLTLLIAGLGALSALALGLMINASKYLSLTLFGLLSYVEPVLLVVVALLLGESIAPDQWLTYGAIWAAIVVLVLEGLRALRRGRG